MLSIYLPRVVQIRALMCTLAVLFLVTAGVVPAGAQDLPDPPERLTVAEAGRDWALVTWQPSPDPTVRGYRLYRSIDGEAFTPVLDETLPAVSVRFRDQDLPPQTEVAYRIAAVNADGEGPMSESASAFVGSSIEISSHLKLLALAPGERLSTRLLFSGENELQLTDDTAEVSVTLEPEDVRVQAVILPRRLDFSEGDQVGAMLTVRAGHFARPAVYTLFIEAQGTDAETGRRVSGSTLLRLQVIPVGARESAIVLGYEPDPVPIGRVARFFGAIVPTPREPTAEIVTVEYVFAGGTSGTIEIPVNEKGAFSRELKVPLNEPLRVRASWDGDEQYAPATSEWLDVSLEPGPSHLTIEHDLAFGSTSGVVRGSVWPRSTVGTPVNVYLVFQSRDGNTQFRTMETVYTGSQPGEAPNEYSLPVDLADTPVAGIPGVWEVWTWWAGSRDFLPARSRVLRIPVEIDYPGAVIVLAAGDPKDPFFGTSKAMAIFADAFFEGRCFDDAHRVFLSADYSDDASDPSEGPATIAALREAVRTSGADQEHPLYLYIHGSTTLSEPYGYELNPDGEVLDSRTLGDILAELPDGTESFLLLDGRRTGPMIDQNLCARRRRIVSFSGIGPSTFRLLGRLSVSRYLLSALGQGMSLGEAFYELHSIIGRLGERIGLSMPMIETDADCLPNQTGDFLELRDSFIGYDCRDRGVRPLIYADSGDAWVPRYGNSTLIAVGGDKPTIQGGTGGAMSGWIRYEDPDGQVNLESSTPILTVLSPAGDDQTFVGAEAFTLDEDDRYIVSVPWSIFEQAGAYTFVFHMEDAGENLSPPTIITVYAVDSPARLLAGGFMDTRLSSGGGTVRVRAMIFDANGAGDIREVSLAYQNTPIDLSPEISTFDLYPEWTDSPRFLLASWDIPLEDATLPSGRFPIQIIVLDGDTGATPMLLYPSLNVPER
jgi:hypothetical protein